MLADAQRTPQGRELVTILAPDTEVVLVLEPNSAGEFDVVGAVSTETGLRIAIPSCFQPSIDVLVAAGEALEALRA